MLPLTKTHFCKHDSIWEKEESANTICQWTVILRNKTPCINFSIVFFHSCDRSFCWYDGSLQVTHLLKNISHKDNWKETADNKKNWK